MKLAHAGRLAWNRTGKAHSFGRSYGKMQMKDWGKQPLEFWTFATPPSQEGKSSDTLSHTLAKGKRLEKHRDVSHRHKMLFSEHLCKTDLMNAAALSKARVIPFSISSLNDFIKTLQNLDQSSGAHL